MNEEGIRKRIHTLLDEIQNEADPVLLNRCRSIFRQEVSFFRRSYMAAYLLLLAQEGKAAVVSSGNRTVGDSISGCRGKKTQESRVKSGDKSNGKEQAELPRFLSEEESVRLFISIGRNRKVFTRDILALVSSMANVTRDDIGTVRVLDNFSFIQVRNSVADAVIQALNGYTFRGRNLTVNHARSRREGEEDAPDAQPDNDHGEQ
ncbi:MAG: DbpA RNA binding domain-containing protein [Spirochaetaceae bacterium]|jgi:hypothetical protein|nr:DbpA RNA binding domain-containing protein [Spirochaetaceae bacterium]